MNVWLGICNIDFLMFAASLGSTSDGLRAGDTICFRYLPKSFAHKGVTAALNAAAKENMRRGVAASPVCLPLPRLMSTNYTQVFGSLMEGFERLHLPIVNFSVADVEELRDAQAHPKRHRDLVVRVWGHNAYFIDLNDGLPRYIIGRTL